MNLYLMTHVATVRKIAAIKALRHVFDIGLKEAKGLIDGEGFIVTDVQRLAVYGFIMVDNMNAGTEAGALAQDWVACRYERPPEYASMLGNRMTRADNAAQPVSVPVNGWTDLGG